MSYESNMPPPKSKASMGSICRCRCMPPAIMVGQYSMLGNIHSGITIPKLQGSAIYMRYNPACL